MISQKSTTDDSFPCWDTADQLGRGGVQVLFVVGVGGEAIHTKAVCYWWGKARGIVIYYYSSTTSHHLTSTLY